APRIAIAYSLGNQRPLVIRAGYGLFFTRIPQIYNSTIESQNGLTPDHLFLNNTNYYDHQIFPHYPTPLVNCAPAATVCNVPTSLLQYMQSDVSAFAHNFRTPEVHQANLTLEREMAGHFIGEVSYTFVRGQNLIRAVDANLPAPVSQQYPVFDSTGSD